MSRIFEKSNEALAILAQRGCEVVREKALELLLRRNEGLIYDKALTYWNYVLSSDIDRSLTLDDLVQLGRIKFCEALPAFDPLRGTKLTTFMTAVLNNYMIDTIRPGLKEKEAIGGEFHWLDHYEGSEDQLTFLEKYIDPRQKKPEPILLEKEHRWEVFDSLDGCTPREKTYLAYRFGYPSDEEQTKKDTREHFGSARQEPKIWSSRPARISKKTTARSSAKPKNRCVKKIPFTNHPATRRAPIPTAA